MVERSNIERGRGVYEYSAFLFPEDLTGSWLLNPIMSRVLESTSPQRIKNNFVFYGLDENDPKHLKNVNQKEIYREYGGQRSFFKKGATILDLGSGGGKATAEYSLQRKGVNIIGLDTVYKEKNPIYPSEGMYTGGDWKRLPFKDDTFTGILACESYPRGMGSNPDSITKTFREITRASKEGAVWRATTRVPDSMLRGGAEIGEEERRTLVNALTYNGWEAYIDKGILIARLEKKFTTL